MKTAAAVALLAGAALAACPSGNMDAGCNYKEQTKADFVMMVETWPGTFCNDGCCKMPDGYSTPTEFTIHGYWPNYNSGYPACCKSSYQEGDISDIFKDAAMEKKLNTYWPALKRCKFVEYEFEKHGTCAMNVYNGTSGVKDYLNAALNLREKYNLLEILADAGIKPSDSTKYPASQIREAISAAVGAEVVVTCTSGQLAEVRICTQPTPANKELPDLIDCPSTSQCNSNILIPTIPDMEQGGCDM